MIGSLKKTINKALSGSERSKVIKKNVIGSFAVKGLSIVTSLFMVPVTIKLLDVEKYGIWITIFSIVTWLNMMDIGLGNGFRNKFVEAVARKETKLATQYVQTLYSSLGLISIGLLFVYSGIHYFINWYSILNVKQGFDENIQLIVWWVIALFCFQLFLKNISTILLALQRTTFSNSLLFLANLSSLIIIFLLQKFNVASLFSISMAFMITPVLIYAAVSFYLFSTSLKVYKPAFIFFPKKEHFNSLIGLGIKFFFIQITTVVMFSSANLIITQLFGPKDVTPYNLAYRLFSSTLVFLTIITAPFWSAFTEANAKKDHQWIIKSINKLIVIWAFFSVGILLLWLVSPYVINYWVGQKINASYALTFQFAFFTIIMGWNTPFVSYITSIGKIRLELYIALIQCILTVPIAIFLARNLNLGTTGVIMATNFVLLIPAILIPIQYYKLINGKATGIWNK